MAKQGNQIRRTLSNVRQTQSQQYCNQQRLERLYLQKGGVYHRHRWLSSVDSVASTQRNEQTTGIGTDTKQSQFVIALVNVQVSLWRILRWTGQ